MWLPGGLSDFGFWCLLNKCTCSSSEREYSQAEASMQKRGKNMYHLTVMRQNISWSYMFLILHPLLFVTVNKTIPEWNSVAFTVLHLHKGPCKTRRKTGCLLGLHPQKCVFKKHENADGRYHKLAKPGKEAKTMDPEEGMTFKSLGRSL